MKYSFKFNLNSDKKKIKLNYNAFNKQTLILSTKSEVKSINLEIWGPN